MPGRVNARTGEILSGGYVDLSGPPLGPRLRQARSRFVFNDNDANMALVAEHRLGAAAGLDHVVLLTIGTGVGGALMDGRAHPAWARQRRPTRPYRRRTRGRALQLRKARLLRDDEAGERRCGRLIAGVGFPAGTAIEALLARDDASARGVVERWALTLRAGLDTLAAAFDPEVIVLGGGLGAAAAEALTRAPERSPWFQYAVACAKLGPAAGVVGAALAALERKP